MNNISLLFLIGMQLCSFVNVVCAVSVFEKRHCRIVQKIALYSGIHGLLQSVTYILQTTRRKRKATTIGDFYDDEWGFGQLIAVFIWVPLCLRVVYYATRFAVQRLRKLIVGVFKDDRRLSPKSRCRTARR